MEKMEKMLLTRIPKRTNGKTARRSFNGSKAARRLQ
jgi:hypothetical protein